ncbi:MAG: hypothetical protein LLF94_05645 [Chlamydiales bacterium]|nr:hypothetical protein [Chlamydiales bacterium]
MNNDGWGFLGAGTSDNRLAGEDLQHNRQNRTADELHVPVRIVKQPRESGGPMKHHLTHAEEVKGGHHSHEHHPMHHHLEEEKHRHEKAMEHHHHHLERHHGRHYNTQHGHDHHKY